MEQNDILLSQRNKGMDNLNYVLDEKGRIIRVVQGNKQATITWTNNDNIDIEYVNLVLSIMFTSREVGGNIYE